MKVVWILISNSGREFTKITNFCGLHAIEQKWLHSIRYSCLVSLCIFIFIALVRKFNYFQSTSHDFMVDTLFLIYITWLMSHIRLFCMCVVLFVCFNVHVFYTFSPSSEACKCVCTKTHAYSITHTCTFIYCDTLIHWYRKHVFVVPIIFIHII